MMAMHNTFAFMNQNVPPKKWKTALLIWLFIYPAVTILSLLLFPLMADFPALVRTAVLTLVLVPIMAWWYIPFMHKRFFVWLRK